MGSDRIWEVSEFVGRVWGNKSVGKKRVVSKLVCGKRLWRVSV